nr:MAG TPA: hypothetical protein [Inoviridae sp.]
MCYNLPSGIIVLIRGCYYFRYFKYNLASFFYYMYFIFSFIHFYCNKIIYLFI